MLAFEPRLETDMLAGRGRPPEPRKASLTAIGGELPHGLRMFKPGNPAHCERLLVMQAIAIYVGDLESSERPARCLGHCGRHSISAIIVIIGLPATLAIDASDR